RNLVGLLYALVVALLYMCPLTVILRAPLDWPLLLREYFAGANAAGPYLLAKILYELPFAYGPLLLVAFLYWMTGLTPSLAAFLQFAGVVALTTQASCAMALMVGSLSANPMLTLGILPAFITPMVLFSGFLYDTATLPSYLAWLPKISIVNYGFAALITLQQSLLPAELRGVALKFVNVDPEALGANLLMLTGMTVIFYALTYMFLTLRLRTAMRA
ncbi:atp-binding cassette subfamily member group wbc protein 2, partial [Nannochloropsis gaditana CCMP526]